MPPSPDQSEAQAASPHGETATLTCPDCHTTLQTAADQSVEAPCPVCGTLLRYEAPDRAELAPFQPLRHHSHHSHRKGREKRKEAKSTRKHRVSLRSRLRQANEFANSPTGMLSTCAALCLLLVFCVFLFFKWDRRRRAAALRDRSPTPAADSRPTGETRPAPANPVVPVSLPGVEEAEPDPDPFALSPDQVIEAPAETP